MESTVQSSEHLLHQLAHRGTGQQQVRKLGIEFSCALRRGRPQAPNLPGRRVVHGRAERDARFLQVPERPLQQHTDRGRILDPDCPVQAPLLQPAGGGGVKTAA
eukprot:3056355-Prymnesium_polylepis.1